MSYHRAIHRGIIICSLLFLATVFGCDKIPFLSKFFPSSKKAASPSASVTPAEPALPPDLLTKVGHWTLTVEEFNDKLKSLKEVIPDYDTGNLEAKKLILEELIRQQLLVQDAESAGVAQRRDITDAVDEFRRTLLVREMAAKITEGIDTTDTEAQDYYNQNKKSFMSPAERHLREIVVPTKEEASTTLIDVLKGADFAATAQARSKSASASKGGDLGFIKEPKFPQMETALATLGVGEISSVFKGPDGYYIVKLEEKKGGEPQNFEEVRSEIKTGLTLMKQQQKILGYIDELKKKTTVETHEELLGQ